MLQRMPVVGNVERFFHVSYVEPFDATKESLGRIASRSECRWRRRDRLRSFRGTSQILDTFKSSRSPDAPSATQRSLSIILFRPVRLFSLPSTPTLECSPDLLLTEMIPRPCPADSRTTDAVRFGERTSMVEKTAKAAR